MADRLIPRMNAYKLASILSRRGTHEKNTNFLFFSFLNDLSLGVLSDRVRAFSSSPEAITWCIVTACKPLYPGM